VITCTDERKLDLDTAEVVTFFLASNPYLTGVESSPSEIQDLLHWGGSHFIEDYSVFLVITQRSSLCYAPYSFLPVLYQEN
jgi:hypothetical protein